MILSQEQVRTCFFYYIKTTDVNNHSVIKMNIESEKQRIQEFVDKGNYHAAINLAISAMNECRKDNDQAGIDCFINMIKGIANTMGEKFGS